ncbi:MAG: peptide-binding protein [Candidatus Latescibacterota bacterium]
MPRLSTGASWAALVLVGVACLAGCNREETAWDRVQRVLTSTRDIVVLDGTRVAPLRYAGKDQPHLGDWMVRHTLSDPESLNPYTSSDAGASQVLTYVFESLLYADNEPPYTLHGRVATSYPAISEDRLSYTFELRPDVTFSDGHPLTAEDVLFSMKVIQNPRVLAAHLRNYFAAVRDVRQDGPRRITFVCHEPYFRNDVALGFFEILPRHFYDPAGLLDRVPMASLIDGSWEGGPYAESVARFADQFNQGFSRRVLGSGPYLIEDSDRDVVTQQKVVLTRNPRYWGLGKEELPDPGYVDKVVFKVINNTDAAFVELTNGNLDYHSLRPLEFREKSWSPDFVGRFLKAVEYSHGYSYIGWNNDHPIFGDPVVRKAMTMLTDREGMIANLLFGLAESVVGPIHKFRPEYNADLKPYPYDPEAALQLLETAGWSDTDGDGLLDKEVGGRRVPFRFEITVNSGNQERKDVALTLQHELQDVGIDCQVRELDWSIFLERARSRQFDTVILGWSGGVVFPPDAYQIWHSSQADASGSNHVAYRNAEVDRILEEYRREFDVEKRRVLYQRFQEIIYDEQPYTFLWTQRVARAYSRRFAGVTWYPAGGDLQEWWVGPENQLYR